jgi:hypothetical protein
MIPSYISLRLAFGAVTILCAATVAIQAQVPDFTISNFDTIDDVTAWSRAWGAAPQTYEFDSTMDSTTNSNSGSLKGTVEFDVASFTGDNQFAVVGGFPDNAVLDATQYTNLVFDLRWEGASPVRAGGDFGVLDFGFRLANSSQYWLAPASPYVVPGSASNGWIRVTAPINPGGAGLDQVTGVIFKMWSGDPNTGFTGPATFWIDNVHLVGRETTQTPAPTLSISEAGPGLRIYASGSGQYQRQNIRTVTPAFSWVGATGPVTYSYTIADYPQASNPGFQTHLFLVPGEGIPAGQSSPDWNQPNVVFLDLQNSAAGTATATFRYKINAANANGMYYNSNPNNGPAGALASITAPSAVGTWSLSFSGDNNVTITTPTGSSTNFVMPSDAAALFANPLYAYLGIQPNQNANLGQSARFTRFQVTGIAEPLNETFAGVVPDPEGNPDGPLDLDPAIWERSAENAAGVVLVPTNAAFSVDWTVPAAGFKLQRSDSLTNPNWTDVTAASAQIGDRVRTTVTGTGARGFYRLVKL